MNSKKNVALEIPLSERAENLAHEWDGGISIVRDNIKLEVIMGWLNVAKSTLSHPDYKRGAKGNQKIIELACEYSTYVHSSQSVYKAIDKFIEHYSEGENLPSMAGRIHKEWGTWNKLLMGDADDSRLHESSVHKSKCTHCPKHCP